MSCNQNNCDFTTWYYSCRPGITSQNLNPPPINIQSVNYIIDYDNLGSANPPILYAQITNNPDVIVFDLKQPIYDARVYCDSPINTPIGSSYYTATLYPTETPDTFEGPYNASNIFTLNDFTYTIYKVGILRQTLSSAYDGTNYGTTVFPIQGGVTIVTENVTGINILQPDGSSFTTNAVKINNVSGFCAVTGIAYTEYAIAYDASSLVQRPPPPRPPQRN